MRVRILHAGYPRYARKYTSQSLLQVIMSEIKSPRSAVLVDGT